MKESQLYLILSHIVMVGCLLCDAAWIKVLLLTIGMAEFYVSRMELRREEELEQLQKESSK